MVSLKGRAWSRLLQNRLGWVVGYVDRLRVQVDLKDFRVNRREKRVRRVCDRFRVCIWRLWQDGNGERAGFCGLGTYSSWTYPELADIALQYEPCRLLALLRKLHCRFVLRHRFSGEHYPKSQQYEELALRYADPFDVEAQKEIEAAICQNGIDKDCTEALKLNPEAFAVAVMPFVMMNVRGFSLKALVDSASPLTIMSSSCAEQCGLLSILDPHYKCITDGVDLSKILGRIHLAIIQIGCKRYPCSILVVDSPNMEFIFGLDMLQKHKFFVDFNQNALRVHDRRDSVPFVQRFESSEDLALFDVDRKWASKSQKRKMGDEIPSMRRLFVRVLVAREMLEVFQVVIHYFGSCDHEIYGKIKVWTEGVSHCLYERDEERCQHIKSGQCLLLTGPTKYMSAGDDFYFDVNLKLKDTSYEIKEELFCFDILNPRLYGRLIHEKIAGSYFSATLSYVAWTYGATATVEVTLVKGVGTVYGLLNAGSDMLNERPTTTLFKKSSEEYVQVPKKNKVIELSRSVVAVDSYSTLIVYAHLKDHLEREIAIGVVEFPVDVHSSRTNRKFIAGEHGEIKVKVTFSLS